MRRLPAGPDRLWAIAALTGALPVLVATLRALARGWIPMGDNAYFSIRARDVLTEHHPLLGAWSSGSVTVGVDVNNLGPLQLDLLALPAKVDWQAGTAVGVAATNIAAVVLAVWVAHRVAGPLGAVLCATGAAGTSLALGSELLYEPRQHHALVLPFLCFLVLVWALVTRWRWALPWTAFVASLLVQTHLTYAVPVALLGAGGLVCWILAARRAPDPEERAVWPVLAATAAVVLLAWAQPVVEQLTADDEGNFRAVLRAGQAAEETMGPLRGLRATADVVALPPWWLPPSFEDFDPEGPLPSTTASLAAMAALVAVLGGAAVVARRHRDGVALAAIAVAAGAVVAAWVTASTQTATGVLGIVPGNFRWLWPASVMVWFGLGLTGARALARTDRGALAPPIAWGAAALLAVLALVPASRAEVLESDEPLLPVARDLLAQLDTLDGLDRVVVERGDLFFAEPYTYVLMAGLQDRGIDFQVAEEVDVQRFGEGRRPDGTADGHVRLVSGDAALDVHEGEERVALARGMTTEEQRELRALRRQAARSEPEDERLQDLERRWSRETVALLYRPATDRPTGG